MPKNKRLIKQELILCYIKFFVEEQFQIKLTPIDATV